MPAKPPRLDEGYSAGIEPIPEPDWHAEMPQFTGATIYQTWAGAMELGARRAVLPFVLRFRDEIVSMALVRLKTVPLLRIGFASVYFGPLWRSLNQPLDAQHFRQCVRALYDEFVLRRNLTLRIFPFSFQDDPYRLAGILAEEGFAPPSPHTFQRRMVVDLHPSVDELRDGMSAHARRNLRTAQRNGLEIFRASSAEHFDCFERLYSETAERKNLRNMALIAKYRRVQLRLPKELKLTLLLCRSNGHVCAGTLFSCMGETCFFFASGANAEGRRNRASYLLHWESMLEAKDRGAHIYDLDGIDPDGDFGSYRFKAGLAGVHARDLLTLGRFDAHPHGATRQAMRLAERWKRTRRLIRFKVRPAQTVG